MIPTFNGASRLPPMLEALREQKGLPLGAWEVVIADNGSEDGTLDVVDAIAQQWAKHDSPRLTSVESAARGAHYARCAGFNASRGTWVAFLDDDNIPDPNWLNEALNLGQSDNRLGAIAGRVSCVFPSEMDIEAGGLIDSTFAGNRLQDSFEYLPSSTLLPPTAGLVVRREAWQQCVPENLPLTGRNPRYQLAGEDTFAVGLIQASGWKVRHHAAMHLTHQLDTRRLELTKLLQTVWASGTTRIIARFFATARHSAPWAIVLLVGACVRDGCRWIVHAVRHTMAGRRADLAVQAELAFLRGTFTGPWTVWRIGALATSWRCARRFTSQPREAIG